jgi:hypothetical protein
LATDTTTGCTGQQRYTVAVVCPTITLSPTSLPEATVGSLYSQTIMATGGTGPYTYSTDEVILPAGLVLSSAGVLSGTPLVAGMYTISVTATDSRGCDGAQSCTLTALCPTLTLKPTSATLPTKGGSKSVSLQVKGSDCSWMAVSNDPFITITSSSSGSGNGTVHYTVLGNANTTARTGTMTIAGQIFTVNQEAGGCTFSLSPKEGKFKAAGGSGTVKVKPNFSDCAWTVVKNPAFSFITITNGASGVGEGTVSYTVAPNSNDMPQIGSITIGGELFVITEDGAQ